MTSVETVFQDLEARRESHLARLFAYLRLPSISALNIGIRETADYIAGEMRAIGLDTILLESAGHPFVYGECLVDPALPTVLFYGHYDVQPPDPLAAWTTPPFAPSVRAGRIYARGVGDNKGQHFANLLAIEAWLRAGGLPCNAKVLLEGEEEIGSPHVADLCRRERERLRADLLVCADGPVHESGQACIQFGVRGVLSFELRAHGAKRDLHSGNWGGVAPQPAWTLVHVLASMRSPDGRLTLAGLEERVAPASAAERAALAALPIDEPGLMAELGVTAWDAPAGRAFYDRLALHPTLTINGLGSGYTGEGSKTVLPGSAMAKCDIRLVADQTVADVWARVQAHVARQAPEVEVVFQGGMDPAKTPIDSAWVAPLTAAIERGRGETPLLVPAMGGSLPYYAFTDILRLPAFVVPYANADEANHAPNENLELERFFDGIKTGAALLSEIAGSTG